MQLKLDVRIGVRVCNGLTLNYFLKVDLLVAVAEDSVLPLASCFAYSQY